MIHGRPRSMMVMCINLHTLRQPVAEALDAPFRICRDAQANVFNPSGGMWTSVKLGRFAILGAGTLRHEMSVNRRSLRQPAPNRSSAVGTSQPACPGERGTQSGGPTLPARLGGWLLQPRPRSICSDPRAR